MPIFYIVSTPIGNLGDISKRALKTLQNVDLILCEDTRVTKKILNYYQIKTPTLSYHQHSEIKKIDYIFKLLKDGKNLALVSDAGTPGISDPGNKLINLLVKGFVNKNQLIITPIPGPCAAIAAASVSGFSTDKFLFLGFPPAKKRRRKFFEEIANSKYSVIFYESPFRIIKSLNELNSLIGKDLREIVVCRELTKKFETIYRGKIGEVLNQLKKSEIRGEFVVIIEGKN